MKAGVRLGDTEAIIWRAKPAPSLSEGVRAHWPYNRIDGSPADEGYRGVNLRLGRLPCEAALVVRAGPAYWISPRISPGLHAAVWTFTYATPPALRATTNAAKSAGAPAAAR